MFTAAPTAVSSDAPESVPNDASRLVAQFSRNRMLRR